MKFDNLTRRRFLKMSAASVAAVPLAAITVRAGAGELEMLAEDNPTAKALGYYADGSAVDSGAFPTYDPAQNCANCIQYKGDADSDAGPCALFPGKLVTAKGWCKVWVAG